MAGCLDTSSPRYRRRTPREGVERYVDRAGSAGQSTRRGIACEGGQDGHPRPQGPPSAIPCPAGAGRTLDAGHHPRVGGRGGRLPPHPAPGLGGAALLQRGRPQHACGARRPGRPGEDPAAQEQVAFGRPQYLSVGHGANGAISQGTGMSRPRYWLPGMLLLVLSLSQAAPAATASGPGPAPPPSPAPGAARASGRRTGLAPAAAGTVRADAPSAWLSSAPLFLEAQQVIGNAEGAFQVFRGRDQIRIRYRITNSGTTDYSVRLPGLLVRVNGRPAPFGVTRDPAVKDRPAILPGGMTETGVITAPARAPRQVEIIFALFPSGDRAPGPSRTVPVTFQAMFTGLDDLATSTAH